MSVTHNWTISTLERNLSDGGVIVAHWRCTSTDDTYTASSYGTCGFTYDSSDPSFVPYDNLTESEVLSWVWADGVDKTQIETSNADKINAQANPTTGDGVPW